MGGKQTCLVRWFDMFSAFVVIPLSALLASAAIIGAALASRPPPPFRWTFFTSFVLALLFLQPWRDATSLAHAGMSAAMLVMIALWVALGHILGAIPAAVLVYLGRKVAPLIRR